jgi:hypothetical protein
MKKISTLFKKNPLNLALVIDEIDPANEWAAKGEGNATIKFDGTACAIINGVLLKRYDVKKGKTVPSGAIPCQEPDAITGHWPHWVVCSRDKGEDKYFFEAYDNFFGPMDGTYELCGPKVNGNPEGFVTHQLVGHGKLVIQITDRSFSGIKKFLEKADIEGIVFHHPDGRMCKIRKSDFGLRRKTQ